MTAFGKHGARCDGCGVFSTNRDGYYIRKNGMAGTISNRGRECDHDYCDDCEGGLAPDHACPKCGTLPDGTDRPVVTSRGPLKPSVVKAMAVICPTCGALPDLACGVAIGGGPDVHPRRVTLGLRAHRG